MNNKVDYNEVLNRMGFFMNRANLSARATSLKLGYTENEIMKLNS